MSETPDLQRRRFCATAAATIAAGQLSLSGISRRIRAMTDVMTELETGHSIDDIRPFRVHFTDEALADLRRRINATQWPERETVADDSQGVPLATTQKLARYWGT